MITGNLLRLGDNVDTDAILPGRYLALKDPASLAAHCLESLDPLFRTHVRPGDIVLAGRNFGTGSSREHAVVALKALGVAAIIASSTARIFYRNAINLGLPVLIAPTAVAELDDQARATIDAQAATITQGMKTWHAQPLGSEVLAILAAGGLMEKVRNELRTDRSTTQKEKVHG